MNKEKLRELYYDLKDIKKDIASLVSYDTFVKKEVNNSFTIDNDIVCENRYDRYSDKVIDVKTLLSTDIIPDVYEKMHEEE
ncbi:MAG: hypothetical protein IJ880_02265 [Bacilli bacterium]|nr:hypothetical protein [Bacilli bacterium]